MFKVDNKDTRTTPLAIAIVLVSLLLTLNIFHTLFSIVNFEHVIAGWENVLKFEIQVSQKSKIKLLHFDIHPDIF